MGPGKRGDCDTMAKSVLLWMGLALSNGFIEERRMRTMLFAVLVSALTLGSVIGVAAAEDSCRSKATGKDGKPLAGAALSSFMTKCVRDACEPRAIDKNGKALSGAAKDSFMKKCQKEA